MGQTRCKVPLKGLEGVEEAPPDYKDITGLELRLGSGLEAGLQAVKRACGAGRSS